MPNTNRVKGLSPVRSGDGNPWNGQATLYAVATDATNSYAIGDVVISAAGTDTDGIRLCVKQVSAGTIPALGIVVGIRIADPGVSLVGNSFSLEKSYLPINAAGANGYHYLYVVDDPGVIFEFTTGADASGTGIQTAFSKNTGLTITANQTTLANASQYSNAIGNDLYTTTAAVGSPIRLMGAVQDPTNVVALTATSGVAGTGAYTRLYGRWNYHEYLGAYLGL
jgi:hypothetical protein